IPALRAQLGPAPLAAAPVADEPRAALVPGHRHLAVIALARLAAARADQDRRVAAPVQEQDHLLPDREPLGDQVAQHAGQRDALARVALLGIAQVLDDDARQPRAARALLELQELVDATPRAPVALEARRRRAEHDAGALDLRAQHRDLARVVA